MSEQYTEEQLRKELDLDGRHHTPLPADHPIMQGFERFKQSEICANNREHLKRLGVTDPETVETLLWTAYFTGFKDGYRFTKVEAWQVKESYNRSKPTTRGGVVTPYGYHFQGHNYQIVEGDCGTKNYLTCFMTSKTVMESFIGRNLVTDGGELVKLSAQNIKQYDGQRVKLRSVMFCELANNDEFCAACVGNLPDENAR